MDRLNQNNRVFDQKQDLESAIKTIQQFLDYLRYERHYSMHTINAYYHDLTGFVGFLSQYFEKKIVLQDLLDATPSEFRSYLTYRRRKAELSARSIARTLSSLRSFYTYLYQKTGQRNDSLSLIKGPRVKQSLPRPLSEDVARSIITTSFDIEQSNWVQIRDIAIFTLLYGTGLRISEALSLKGCDYPFDQKLKVRGKGNKFRYVPLLPVIHHMMKQYVDWCPYDLSCADQALFKGVRGGSLQARIVQRSMQKLRNRLGFSQNVTPHALRHSFASHLLVKGANLRDIQELLGHASLSSTQIYADIDTKTLKEVYQRTHPRS